MGLSSSARRAPAAVLPSSRTFSAQSSVLVGLGLGCSAGAATAVGTSAQGEGEQGLASGLLNTAAQVGTALGVAALVTSAAARTGALTGGPATAAEIVEGYRWAFFASARLAALGVLVAIFVASERAAS